MNKGVSRGFRYKLAIACLAIASTMGHKASLADNLPGKGITVRPVQTEDASAEFQAAVVKIGLEKLGYDVKDASYVDIPAAYVALAQGDGDYYTQTWDPLQNALYEHAGGDEKLARMGTLVGNCLQGYLIDKKTADEHHITSIDQLKDPAVAALFDEGGTGTAGLVGCPPGWGCEKMIEYQLDQYDLRKTVRHVQGDFTATHADVISRVRAGKSVLYYSYTPLWMNQILVPGKDVVWLQVPFDAIPKEQAVPGVQTKLPDGSDLGWPINNIRVTANKEFLAANPAARRWFELVSIPLEDVNAENALVYNGENSNEVIRKHAETWVAAHQSEVDAWVAEASKTTK